MMQRSGRMRAARKTRGCVQRGWTVAASAVFLYGAAMALAAEQPTDSVSVSVNPPSAESNLWPEVTPVAVGFILTTLLGGLLGHHLQNRSWRFQRQESLRELHQAEATKIFDEVSCLLDQRLYRMSLVRWALERHPLDTKLLDARWAMYRRSVFKWNDKVNRNRALVARYFGDDASQRFELSIGEGFVEYGRELEKCYREQRSPTPEEKGVIQSLSERMTSAIWNFDNDLVERIRDGRVGAFLKSER